MLEYIFF